MKYSLTFTGLILTILIPIIGQAGFSEQCSSELANFILTIPGIAVTFWGRYRQGDVNFFGFKQ